MTLIIPFGIVKYPFNNTSQKKIDNWLSKVFTNNLWVKKKSS
jgi:hypothetical protein